MLNLGKKSPSTNEAKSTDFEYIDEKSVSVHKGQKDTGVGVHDEGNDNEVGVQVTKPITPVPVHVSRKKRGKYKDVEIQKTVTVTERQKQVAEAIASGEIMDSKTRGAVLAKIGYSPSSITSQGRKIFTSKGVEQALMDMGVTHHDLVQPIVEAKQATKSTFYQGELVETDAPDHDTRLKATSMALDVLGLNKKHVVNENLNVNVEADDIMDLFI